MLYLMYKQSEVNPMACVNIQMKSSALNDIKSSGLKYNLSDDNLSVIVDDIPYEFLDGTYQQPDEELCLFYGINYDDVNNIELI